MVRAMILWMWFVVLIDDSKKKLACSFYATRSANFGFEFND